MTSQLKPTEYHKFYKNYITKATSKNILEGLLLNLEAVTNFYNAIPNTKHNFVYAEGKWTVKDILLHISDTERILAYRALRIARGDSTPLAGFEQDGFVVNGNANARNLKTLLDEYIAVRQSTIALYKSFDSDSLLKMGEASGTAISVRALGYIITGHENHHNTIIKELYL